MTAKICLQTSLGLNTVQGARHEQDVLVHPWVWTSQVPIKQIEYGVMEVIGARDYIGVI